jgi:hypothetical protein
MTDDLGERQRPPAVAMQAVACQLMLVLVQAG